MLLTEFLEKIKQQPQQIEFEQTIATIEATYNFTPTAFKNGKTNNEAGQNSGSCKIFAFAQLSDLTPEQTLHCFGRYYRQDVLENPDGDDHQNIRNFIENGWAGIDFAGEALQSK